VKHSGRTNRDQHRPPTGETGGTGATVVALFPGLAVDGAGGVLTVDRALFELADLVSDAVTITDAAGRIVYANPSTARFVGVDRADRLVGAVPRDGIGPIALSRGARRRHAEVLAGAAVLGDLELLRRVDGTFVPCRVDAVPCRIEGTDGILTVAKILLAAIPDGIGLFAGGEGDSSAAPDAAVVMCSVRPDGSVVPRVVNDEARRLLGIPSDDLDRMLSGVGAREEFRRRFVVDGRGRPVPPGGLPHERTGRTGVPVLDGVFGLTSAHGTRWLRSSSRPVSDEHGRPIAVLLSLAAIDGAPPRPGGRRRDDGPVGSYGGGDRSTVTVFDIDGTARATPGVTRRAFPAGRVLTDAVHPEDRAAVWAAFLAVSGPGRRSTDVAARVTDPSGEERTLELCVSGCVDDPLIRGVVVYSRPVPARPVRRPPPPIQPPGRDPLTGLLTRSELVARIEQAGWRGARWALLLVDIDRFIALNESLGHMVADAVLREVADRVARTVGDAGLVARLRSDDFAVLVDGQGDGTELAARIARVVAQPIDMGDGDDVTVTVSVGIRVPPAGTPPSAPRPSADRLLLQAEHALFIAKRGGRRRAEVFDEAMAEGARRLFDTESLVRRAVEHGEVVVQHQPIVSLHDGRVYGTEALVRLGDGRGGLLAEHLVAEDTGLIVPLGAEVLRQACRQQARWLSAPGGPRRVSVNVAARQLDSAGFVAEVAGILAECGLAAEHLCLELTESSLLDADREAEKAVHELVDLGVTLALDDFGTGWSSLGYLRRLPVGELKIDRSFVVGLATTRNDAEVVRAIVGLGHALGLTVVAEGVERSEQAAGLSAMGCELAQGYLYARPGAPDGLDLGPWSVPRRPSP
jgi:diguanylate cyclase (GGDEF)-like protein